MARPVGQLERSLASLTIGMAQGIAERKRVLKDTVTGEYIQQVRVPINGVATDAVTYADKPVQWEMPFLYAPLQRRVPFETPHFTPGIEIISGQNAFIDIRAQVIQWTITEEEWYVGATVRFAANCPGATDLFTFSAIGHLSFQGYATMAETDEFAQ